jgi:hypothetical protein
MIASQLAHIIADMMYFICFADKMTLHPDAAARLKADIGRNLRSFDTTFLQELINAFAAIPPEYGDGTAQLARDIPGYFGLERVPTEQREAGAMPAAAVQAARLIADFFVYLDHVDDDLIDPDTNVAVGEGMAATLQALDKSFLRELVDAFPIIASEYEGEERNSVLTLAESFYLEETLAEDDPVRLAELEALRDARD